MNAKATTTPETVEERRRRLRNLFVTAFKTHRERWEAVLADHPHDNGSEPTETFAFKAGIKRGLLARMERDRTTAISIMTAPMDVLTNACGFQPELAIWTAASIAIVFGLDPSKVEAWEATKVAEEEEKKRHVQALESKLSLTEQQRDAALSSITVAESAKKAAEAGAEATKHVVEATKEQLSAAKAEAVKHLAAKKKAEEDLAKAQAEADKHLAAQQKAAKDLETAKVESDKHLAAAKKKAEEDLARAKEEHLAAQRQAAKELEIAKAKEDARLPTAKSEDGSTGRTRLLSWTTGLLAVGLSGAVGGVVYVSRSEPQIVKIPTPIVLNLPDPSASMDLAKAQKEVTSCQTDLEAQKKAAANALATAAPCPTPTVTTTKTSGGGSVATTGGGSTQTQGGGSGSTAPTNSGSSGGGPPPPVVPPPTPTKKVPTSEKND